jgi:PAS domain S-box-containing protein
MSNLALEWQNSHLLAAVFNQLSDALIIYDSNLQISGVNEAAERLFGLSTDEMVGRDCRDVFRCGVCEPGC